MFEGIGGIFLLLAVWLWWTAALAIIRGLRSRTWPSTTGVIREAAVKKKNNSKGREVWRYVIEYSYSVDGKKYRNSRMRFGIPNSLIWTRPSAPTFRSFRKKDAVEVIHSPTRPGVCALERGFHPFIYASVIAGGLFVWMAWGLFNAPG
jgi:hypothetical protein